MWKCQDIGEIPIDAQDRLLVLFLPQRFAGLCFPDNDKAWFIAAGKIGALRTCGQTDDSCIVTHERDVEWGGEGPQGGSIWQFGN